MTTIKDIARLSGTSPTAVSFVLNNKDEGKVDPLKKKRILELIGEHSYRQNRIAQSLKLKKTFNIAICFQGSLGQYPIIGHYSHYELLSQIAQNCHHAGYSNDLIQVDIEKKPAQATLELKHHNTDGFLFLNWSAETLRPVLKSLHQRHIPVVSVGMPLSDSPLWVSYDRAESFFNGVKYLLGQGLSKICVLDTMLASIYSASKYKAYQSALQTCGLNAYPPFQVSSSTIKSVMTTLKELLRTVPDVDGIILTDNAFAPYIVSMLEGQPIRILGFGDEGYARMCEPRLSYMRFPIEAVAESAINMLMNCLSPIEPARRSQQHHQCTLIVQET